MGFLWLNSVKKVNKLIIFRIPEGDWEALYVNGELKCEGHKIKVNEISKYTPIEKLLVCNIENFDSDYDWFPRTIKEFPEHWIIQ